MSTHPSFSVFRTTFLLLCASCVQHTFASVGILDSDTLLPPNSNGPQKPILPSHNIKNDFESPWSHKPICARSTSLSSPGKKYCVYTSNLTGPAGMSMIVSPSIAAEAAPLLNDNPLDNFLTLDQAEQLYSGNPPYKVVEIEGKGMGVIATRPIAKFETIMVDQAAVVVALNIEKMVGKKEARRLLHTAVEQLRVPGEVRGLSGEHKASSEGDAKEGEQGKIEEDVMLTNAFGSEIAGIDCRALFPLISRINHACNPNAFVLFSRAGISMAVKAYRPIAPGEELSISYITLGQPSRNRAAALARWGFSCTCPLCSLADHEKQHSDILRSLISQSEGKILELAQAGRLDDAIALTEESIQMIEEEQQEHFLTDSYALLAKLWLVKGDRGRAEVEARKSFDRLVQMGFLGNGVGNSEREWEEWDLEGFLEVVGEGMVAVVPPKPEDAV
ncbi:SET domain-containing protein [Lentithecium fluviatile CBS 122367]|uniref:SET domain-containing protein n=1 Tax=Lentithecium fluviatile CBS 122367 TaxID=1168545 RepID=A0A6G1IGJ6_9PLEO|nr:SET domain-containing protein [Lentithecium fluviatile CBS 122367]